MNKPTSLADLVEEYFNMHKLPYVLIKVNLPGPSHGIRKSGGSGWLGWVYDREFKSYNHGDQTAIEGVIKHLHATDPEFFEKLIKFLPECEHMWNHYDDYKEAQKT